MAKRAIGQEVDAWLQMGNFEPFPDFIVQSNAVGKDPLFFGSSVLRCGTLSVSDLGENETKTLREALARGRAKVKAWRIL